ncbi:uncharacterized protein LOC134211735 [Armigeres subalbatus]|uniref:uncharacterized protein LOC134211735 n=1 Tax=Armigeres subalbatus TaxID=124917 RepID=UPI002ED1DE82
MLQVVYKENKKGGSCKLCSHPDKKEAMVQCDDCFLWFHQSCVNLDHLPSEKERWQCPRCMEIYSKLKMAEVKKSSQFETFLEIQKESQETQTNMIKKFMQVMNIKLEQDASSSSPNVVDPIVSSTHVVNLLAKQSMAELPYFDGCYKVWPRFKAAFDATTTAGGFSNLDNLSRLHKYLKGKAMNSVAPLMVEANNIPSIIDRLEQQFGRPQVVYNGLLEELTNVKAPRMDNPKTMIDFITALENMVTNMKILKQEDYLNDQRLIKDLSGRLPMNLYQSWLSHVTGLQAAVNLQNQNQFKAPSLETFYNWLKPQGDLAVIMLSEQPKRNNKPINVHSVKDDRKQFTAKQGLNCFACKQYHKTSECGEFKNMDLPERMKLVQQNRLCFACCNSSNHTAYNCRWGKVCNVDGCKSRNHHNLLHRKQSQKENLLLAPARPMEKVLNLHSNKGDTLYQIMPVTLENGSVKLETYALFDPGSSSTLISEQISKQLNVNGKLRPLSISWTNGNTQDENQSLEIEMKIRGTSGKRFLLKEVRTVNRLSLPKQTVDFNKIKQAYPYLQDAEVSSYRNAVPTMLLGLPHAYLMHGLESRGGKFNEPIAMRTRLGWVVYGCEGTNSRSNKTAFVLAIETKSEEKSLNEIVKEYFSTEQFGVMAPEKPLISKNVVRANDIMHNTLKYSNGYYEIGLLWKDDEFQFPDSYQSALGRLKIQEKKMSNNPGIKTWYTNKIKEYVEKGYARKLDPSEVKVTDKRTYYLPYFLVINENKIPRLVFDAKAEIKGESFNSKLLAGPDATASLLGVLIRFREHSIAVVGDIKEMFHQIRIREADQKAQCFLFRDDPNKNPDIYVMQVMTFGATCSPACAQFVKNINAAKFTRNCPEAVNVITKNHYVDDCLASFQTPTEAIKVMNEVIKIHDHANFYIRKFVSNSDEVLKGLPMDRIDSSKLISLDMNEPSYQKVLGIQWDTEKDEMVYRIDCLTSLDTLTKRQLLSFVARVYDPLGLISNVTIESRIILQDLWRRQLGWDDEVPEDIKQRLVDWYLRVERLDSFRILRCYSKALDVKKREMHVFVDASERAFAAVIYFRTLSENNIDVNIVAAKARVAPMKVMTIPKLELQAALLGTRLAGTIEKESDLEIHETVYWSDNSTVLSWIKSDPRNYKQFVAFRVSEIHDSTTTNQWRWIDSENNPADEATKVVKRKSIWTSGPRFLKEPEENWPKINRSLETNEELRHVNLIISAELQEFKGIQIIWCSNWLRLKRAVCMAKKFIDKLRTTKCKLTLDFCLSKVDLEWAEEILVRKAQSEVFSDEISCLTISGNIDHRSHIRNLNPFLDKKGILRSNGRLSNVSCLPPSAKNHIILPQKHHVTKLILQHYHERFYHQKFETVIAAIRQKFWVVNIRVALKNVRKQCQFCKNTRTKPIPPLMAPLPEFRTTPHMKVFTYTGVDYFGPMIISIGRRTEKRWGALFTCLVTRAVHIEVAFDLSTDSFFLCLMNLQHLRGRIAELYSDNGTNFIGANNELKKIKQRLATEGIDWHFNPPLSPHFGGAWEIMVRETKSLLKYFQGVYREHTLRATLNEIAFIINCRPLTHIPLDSEEEEPLTPNHFILGCSGEAELSLNDVSQAEALKQQWKKAQSMTTQFWQRWIKEYLPTQVKRTKWQNSSKPIEIGDVVVMPDENRKGFYEKGIITEVRPAKDGQVRSAAVRTGKGTFIRPTINMGILDVRKNTNDIREECNITMQNSNNKKSSKVSRLGMFMTVLLTILYVNTANGLQINPIEEGGMLFDHLGGCLVKRGIWITQITSNIVPSEDISRINGLHKNLNEALKFIGNKTKDKSLEELILSIEGQCDNVIQEIAIVRREKRSGGILGFLKNLIFGGNDLEEELQSVRAHEEQKLHELSEIMKTIDVKAEKMGNEFNNRIYNLRKGMIQLQNQHTPQRVEIFKTKLIEATMLATQVLQGISNKYKTVKSHPLSKENIMETLKGIQDKLPNGYSVLSDPQAISFETKIENDTIIIFMNSIIVNRDNFELFQVIPIPNIDNGTIMDINETVIAINHLEDFFYPEGNMKKLNSSHFMVDQPVMMRKTDCVAAAILHKKPKTKCLSKRLNKSFIRFFPLNEPNVVLYYTSNAKEIIIHCDNAIISPPYSIAKVTLKPDCFIRSKELVYYASMFKETKNAQTFFKPLIQLPYEIDYTTLDFTNDTSILEKPKNPYEKEVMVFSDIPIRQETVHIAMIGIGSTLVIIMIIGLTMIYMYKNKTRNRNQVETELEIPTIVTNQRRGHPQSLDQKV